MPRGTAEKPPAALGRRRAPASRLALGCVRRPGEQRRSDADEGEGRGLIRELGAAVPAQGEGGEAGAGGRRGEQRESPV